MSFWFFRKKLKVTLNLDGVKQLNNKDIEEFKTLHPQRLRELAYYLAEMDGFQQHPDYYWHLAEENSR